MAYKENTCEHAKRNFHFRVWFFAEISEFLVLEKMYNATQKKLNLQPEIVDVYYVY